MLLYWLSSSPDKLPDLDKLMEKMDKLTSATSCLCDGVKAMTLHVQQLEAFAPWAIGAAVLMGLGLWRYSAK